MTADPLQMFAESKGIFLSDRSLKFCRLVLKNIGSVAAAKGAGYPDPEGCADALYDEFCEMIAAWRKQNDTDYNLVLGVFREAASAETTIVEFEGNTDVKVSRRVPEHRTRMQGAKGLCDIFGFNAATETKVTQVGEMPEDLKEILDRVITTKD